MSEYFSTNTLTLDSFEDKLITSKYSEGYVLTRIAKGNLNQTRSLRVDLSKFKLSSENRRILNKNPYLIVSVEKLPLGNYSWEIHKLGKEFYSTKFGDSIMSASKIKEMFNDLEKSNMNHVFSYRTNEEQIGFCLTYINDEIVHYAYPFYNLDIPKEKNIGMAMMLKAILWAQENGKKFCYLGSVVDEKSRYKLQFEGAQWWDNDTRVWSEDLNKLKTLLNN